MYYISCIAALVIIVLSVLTRNNKYKNNMNLWLILAFAIFVLGLTTIISILTGLR